MVDEDTPSEPALDAEDLEEVGSVHSIQENDEIHEEPNSDPFDLSDLIRNETEKARAQRMVPPCTDPEPVMYEGSQQENLGDASLVEPEPIDKTPEAVSPSASLSHPPGFSKPSTPQFKNVTAERGDSCDNFSFSNTSQIPNPVVDGLDAMIDMGLAMGFSMKGCFQDKIEVINRLEKESVSQ